MRDSQGIPVSWDAEGNPLPPEQLVLVWPTISMLVTGIMEVPTCA